MEEEDEGMKGEAEKRIVGGRKGKEKNRKEKGEEEWYGYKRKEGKDSRRRRGAERRSGNKNGRRSEGKKGGKEDGEGNR